MFGGTRRRRTLIGLVSILVAALLAAVAAGPAPAAEATGPTVDAIDQFEPQIIAYVDCDGETFTDEFRYGGVLYELSEEADADLSIPVTFSGSLAADLVDPPTTMDVTAGDTWGDVIFELGAVVAGELVVTLEAGDGYVLGDTEVTIEPRLEPELLADCTEELPLDDPARAHQTIRVGERPLSLGFFGEPVVIEEGSTATTAVAAVDDLLGIPAGDDEDLEAEGISTPVANGELPPGLTYVRDRWGGAATTPGTYGFDVRLCVDDAFYVEGETDDWEVVSDRPAVRALPSTICYGFVPVEIVVLPAVVAPPGRPVTPATPATPVRTTARFTG